MRKVPRRFISFDSRSGGLAQVCPALDKTGSQAAGQCRRPTKAIGADLNFHRLAICIASQAPHFAMLPCFQIPIAVLLRSLVQHVLSPAAALALSP